VSRLSVLTVLFLAAGIAGAQEISREEMERCMSLGSDAERLACFERLASPRNGPGEGEEAEAVDGPIAELWRFDDDAAERGFAVTAYKPSFVLPVTWTKGVNRAPYEELENLTGTKTQVDQAEAEFQLSFKLRLAKNIFGDNGQLWFAYTQRSFWQLYNNEESRPFRETDYEPEFMLSFRTDYRLLGMRGRLLGVSLNHQSNGRSDPLSRSWNRVIGFAGFETRRMLVVARAWYRIPENRGNDDNPKILDDMGRGDLLFGWKLGRQHLTALIRSNFDPGDPRAGTELGWSFPIPHLTAVRGYLDCYLGYGESLIDQDFRMRRIGLGVAISDWMRR